MFDKSRSLEFDEAKIDAIFAGLDQCDLPGAAVGIAISGTPVYRKGFGLANMEMPVVLSPTIRMRVASVTKHFASLAYMLLCEHGDARIEDPVGKYIPELHPVTRDVTMRQLMGHTSGLRDVFDISCQLSGTQLPVSSAELLALYRDIDDVNATPGTEWNYCNGNYLLLSVAIERITGRPLEDILWERIFAPVGMYATLLRRWDTDFVVNSATAHVINREGKFEKSNFFGTAWAGEGGMVSTVDDMLRWLAHMDAPSVGGPATWSTIKMPHRLANGTSTGYGLGLFTGRYRGVEIIFHSGGGMGCNAHMVKVPSAGLDVVIMINRDDVWAIQRADEILDTCLKGLDSTKSRPTIPVTHGTFSSPKTGRVIQLYAKHGQQIASIDAIDIPVEPDDAGKLCPIGIARYERKAIELLGDPMEPRSIRFCDFGNMDELFLERPPNKTDPQGIAGCYRSDTTSTQVIIGSTEDGALLTTVGRFGSARLKLDCLADGIWRARSSTSVSWLGGILLFDGNEGSFRFSTFRTRGLGFRRAT